MNITHQQDTSMYEYIQPALLPIFQLKQIHLYNQFSYYRD